MPPTTVGSVSENPAYNTTGIICTSERIIDFINIGTTYIPDIMKCTKKMADLGYDYLVAMNDFYNYNFDDFHHDFDHRAICNNLLCTDADLKYVLSKLLRLRAQMYDMMEMVKYKNIMPKATMRCVYKVLKRFTRAASLAIACPA